VDETARLKVQLLDLMARVLTEQTQTIIVVAVLAELRPRPRPMFPRHSLGSEEMMYSTVVMVVEAVMKLSISIPDLGRRGPPEVTALAGIVKEWCKLIAKDLDAKVCIRNCEGIVVAFCTSSSKSIRPFQ
jgi:hypothetical protein